MRSDVHCCLQACDGQGTSLASSKAPRNETTHLVVGGAKRTLKVLHALAQGKWIVTPGWIYRSAQQGFWAPEDEFEAVSYFHAAPQSRRIAGSLLSGFKIVLPRGMKTKPGRKDLARLIESAGGSAVGATDQSSDKTHVLVDEDELQRTVTTVGPKRITVSWLIESIGAAALLPYPQLEPTSGEVSDEM